MTTNHKMTKPVHILIVAVAMLLVACRLATSLATVEPEAQAIPSFTPQPTPVPTEEIMTGDESLPSSTPTEVPADISQHSPVATPTEEVVEISTISPSATPSPSPTATLVSREANGKQAKGAISDDVVVVFQRSGGFAGITEQWIFYHDGRIEEAGGEQRQVEPQQVQTLLETIQNADFFALNDSYMPLNTCCDRFTYVVTVQLDGQTKSVTTIDASPTQPEQLTTVLNAIGELLNASK